MDLIPREIEEASRIFLGLGEQHIGGHIRDTFCGRILCYLAFSITHIGLNLLVIGSKENEIRVSINRMDIQYEGVLLDPFLSLGV